MMRPSVGDSAPSVTAHVVANELLDARAGPPLARHCPMTLKSRCVEALLTAT